MLIFDNATTHTKRANDALSARKMPKFTPKEGKPNWLLDVNKLNANGKQTYTSSGQPAKTKIPMRDGVKPNGDAQSFYFPQGHARAGIFKGMKVILEERGFMKEANLRAQCPKFKCAPLAISCCCRRVLFCQPDFVNEKSVLENVCEARGFEVLFLPKFHCELNFIEQCWGAAKRVYRMKPVSSKEADLEANVLASLDSVSIDVMRKCVRKHLIAAVHL